MANEEKMKHLDLIQSVITRMASNSFGLGGWLEAVFRPAVVGLHLPLAIAALGACALLGGCW